MPDDNANQVTLGPKTMPWEDGFVMPTEPPTIDLTTEPLRVTTMQPDPVVVPLTGRTSHVPWEEGFVMPSEPPFVDIGHVGPPPPPDSSGIVVPFPDQQLWAAGRAPLRRDAVGGTIAPLIRVGFALVVLIAAIVALLASGADTEAMQATRALGN